MGGDICQGPRKDGKVVHGHLPRDKRPSSGEDQGRNSIALRIQAAAFPDVGHITPAEQPIELVLKLPSDASQATCRIDSARLEAILAVWMRTLISDPRVKGDAVPDSSLAEKFRCSRIISVGLGRAGSVPGAARQGEIDLWLGANAVTFDTVRFVVDGRGGHDIASLWVSSNARDWETLPRGVFSQKQE